MRSRTPLAAIIAGFTASTVAFAPGTASAEVPSLTATAASSSVETTQEDQATHNVVIYLTKDKAGRYTQETRVYDGTSFVACSSNCPRLHPMRNRRGQILRFRLVGAATSTPNFSSLVYTGHNGMTASQERGTFVVAPTRRYVTSPDGGRFLGRLQFAYVELHDSTRPAYDYRTSGNKGG